MTIRKTLLFVLFLYGGGQVMATKDDKEEYDKIYDEVLKMYKKGDSTNCYKIAEEISSSGSFISRKRREKLYKLAFSACLNVARNEVHYGGLF